MSNMSETGFMLRSTSTPASSTPLNGSSSGRTSCMPSTTPITMPSMSAMRWFVSPLHTSILSTSGASASRTARPASISFISSSLGSSRRRTGMISRPTPSKGLRMPGEICRSCTFATREALAMHTTRSAASRATVCDEAGHRGPGASIGLCLRSAGAGRAGRGVPEEAGARSWGTSGGARRGLRWTGRPATLCSTSAFVLNVLCARGGEAGRK